MPHSRFVHTRLAFALCFIATACTGNAPGSHEAEQGQPPASALDWDMARGDFARVPELIPVAIGNFIDEVGRPPGSIQNNDPLKRSAARAFTRGNFRCDRDAAKPVPPPDAATKQALTRFARAFSGLQQKGQAPRLAAPAVKELPTTLAAREQGLALDRLNILSQMTNTKPQMNTFFGSQKGSDIAQALDYSRQSTLGNDRAWGGNQLALVARAAARNATALRSLTPKDADVVRRWYESPGGRAENAWIASCLATAYDQAAAMMWQDYLQWISAGRPAAVAGHP